MELAPKGTGKSFVFDNISRYAAVIPGGKLSTPTLFFNSNSRQIGLIPRYDVVVVDEVQKIQTDAAGEAMAGLKMYLESGRYRRATGDMGTSEAGYTSFVRGSSLPTMFHATFACRIAKICAITKQSRGFRRAFSKSYFQT